MATGYKIPDGRDLSDIFGSGSYGSSVGYQTSDGKDLGYQFAGGGGTGIVTGYTNQAGVDLGNVFGPPIHVTVSFAQFGTVYNRRYGWRPGDAGSISKVPFINGIKVYAIYRQGPSSASYPWDVVFDSEAPDITLYINGYAFTKSASDATSMKTSEAINNIAPNGTLTFSPAPTSYQ